MTHLLNSQLTPALIMPENKSKNTGDLSLVCSDDGCCAGISVFVQFLWGKKRRRRISALPVGARASLLSSVGDLEWWCSGVSVSFVVVGKFNYWFICPSCTIDETSVSDVVNVLCCRRTTNMWIWRLVVETVVLLDGVLGNIVMAVCRSGYRVKLIFFAN